MLQTDSSGKFFLLWWILFSLSSIRFFQSPHSVIFSNLLFFSFVKPYLQEDASSSVSDFDSDEDSVDLEVKAERQAEEARRQGP